MLKTQQWFKSERHIAFTKEIHKIPLISNDHKRMQSNNLIETYAYITSKDLVSKNEEIKFNNITKRYKNNQLRSCYKRKHKRT